MVSSNLPLPIFLFILGFRYHEQGSGPKGSGLEGLGQKPGGLVQASIW